MLHELGAQGLRLIYSSETVPASLRVASEPRGTTAVEILEEVLAEPGVN